MCPMPTASLKAFRMNAESLYSLYCNQGQQKLRFFKYDVTPLQHTTDACNHKDAVSGSFFNMARIQETCKRNKLIFAHNITILPGLQHVRLLGTKTNKPKETTASLRKQHSISNILESTWQEIPLQSEKDKKMIKDKIATLEKEVNDLSKNMRQAYKTYNDGNFGIQIKVAKHYWKNPFSQPSATQALPTEPSRPSTPSEKAEAGLCGCLPEIFNIIRNAINTLRGSQSGQQELLVAVPTELQKKASDDIQKEISQLINLLKEKRYKSYLAVEECKRELSD
ncbi:hypothetical protein A0J61_10880 [Choanephora cucurbitarum]|uniref:Uncharacterized protein n=1 Tax=Choanephora cucurbitarum TaxID=101091 RepID=A0A1C7MW53_9FUNG|nr:hypothetical protein A0J61_10880 [Choanephora cucurbitarum]